MTNHCRINWVFITGLALLPFLVPAQPAPWYTKETITGAHDPTLIKDESGIYTLLTTNNLCEIRQSSDMINWTSKGRIFSAVPAWMKSVYADIADLWAPHISFHDNKYWVYYCGSSFGSRNSLIGVVSSPTLNTSDPNYKWTDLGEVYRTTTSSNVNAIDPDLIKDKNGKFWLSFGSWSQGIRMIEIDPATGKQSASNKTLYSLASRNGSGIEGPTTIEHNGNFFLFTSWDACCAGTNSTYKTMVGRSSIVTGPYVNKAGASLMNGVSELALEHYGRYYGPGGGSTFKDGRRDYYVHHYYDGNKNGNPTLQIREIVWDKDNWPIITQPYWGRRLSFEAEHAELTNASISSGTLASGQEYVGMINYSDSKIKFHVNVLASGEYNLRIHYSSGGGASFHLLKVNTDPAIEVNYPSTPKWSEFPETQVFYQKVILKEGYNTIEFSRGSGNVFAELDRIDLTRAATSKIEAGSNDDGIYTSYIPSTNNASINNKSKLKFENIDFENGGLKSITLGLAVTNAGQITFSIDGENSSTNASFTINSMLKTQTFTLPVSLQSLKGIHDIYVKSNADYELDYFQFSSTVTEISKQEDDIKSLMCYPNPFEHSINLAANGRFTYEISNLTGQLILKDIAENNVLTGNELHPGTYLVKIQNESGTQVIKICKNQPL